MPPPRQVGTATGSPGAGTALGGTGVALPCQGQRPVSGGGSGTAGDVGPCPLYGAVSSMWGWQCHGAGAGIPCTAVGWRCAIRGAVPIRGRGQCPTPCYPPPKVPSSEPHIPGAGQDRAQPLSTQLRPHPLCPLQARRGTRCRAGAACPSTGCVSLAPWGSGSPRGCFPSSPPLPPSSPGASWRGG